MERSALVYIVLTVVTVALGLCVDNREENNPVCDRRQARNRIAIFAIYCLLTGVSACRIAVGNDYWVYRDNFKLIAQSRHVSSEFGFNYIVKWIQQLFGYDEYLPVFAFFSIVTVFFFVKALSDQGSSFVFSLYLLMTGGYYFNSLNSVRYYLALAIALYSMKYVLRGEYGKFALWILAGVIFHKSILLVIPVYLLARFLASAPLKKWHCAVGGVFVGTLIFGQNVYREIIFYFYPYYRDSMFDNGQLSYVNILKCVCVLVLCLVCYRRSLCEDLMNRFYFFLNLFGLMVYCCGSFIPEVSRVGYYMIVSQVFLLPRLLMQMPGNTVTRETMTIEKAPADESIAVDVQKGGEFRRWFRGLCYVGVIGAFGAYFILLLKGMYAVDVRLLPYLNWIFN